MTEGDEGELRGSPSVERLREARRPLLAVEMRGITKRFGPVVANDRVDLAVEAGEVHCLLGENGAGKTTLMRILFGLERADAGQIRVFGRPRQFRRPSDAIAAGLGMVHQHFMLVGRMTVVENIVAGLEPVRRRLLVDSSRAAAEIADLSRRYGLPVDPGARVEALSVGQQQRVEILKALYRQARILILDEPTAVLTSHEVDELFSVMRALRSQGVTIIFITHKLRETFAVADRVTVLRDGRRVATLRTADTSPEELARLMVGRDVQLGRTKPAVRPGPVVLSLRHVTLRDPRAPRPLLRDVSLDVRAGEIVGIAGVEGNGQLELEEVVAGLRRPTSGEVLLGGERVTGLSPRQRRLKGLGYIPSDRLRRGLVPEFSVADNLTLGHHFEPPFAIRGIRQSQAVARLARELMEAFDIRAASPDVPVATLSGGNQQKVVLARELSRAPRLILAAQPTRGVDVGAVEFIHGQLLKMRSEGRAILLISADLDELRLLADRIAVLYEGQIVDERPAEQFTEAELGLLMAGRKPASAPAMAS